MGGAPLPMAIAWRIARRSVPFTGGSYPAPPQGSLSRSPILGSVLFGIGRGLVGLCPGPALATLNYRGWPGVVFAVAKLAGMVAVPPLRRVLDRRIAAP